LVPLLGVEPELGVGHFMLLAGIVPVLDGSADVLPIASGAFLPQAFRLHPPPGEGPFEPSAPAERVARD